MKKLINLALALSIMSSSTVSMADGVRTENPESIDSLMKNGFGAEYRYMIKGGATKIVRVQSLEMDSKTNSLKVTIVPKDNAHNHSFENEPIVIRADPVQAQTAPVDNKNSDQPKFSEPAGPDFSVGTTSAISAGLQTAITEGPLADRINSAMADVKKLEDKMGQNFRYVEEIKLNLETGARLVSLKMHAAATTGTSALEQTNEKTKFIIQQNVRAAFSDNKPIQWFSTDNVFLNQAKPIENQLLNNPPKNPITRTYRDISRQALIEADKSNFLDQKEDAQIYLDIAKTAADILIGLDPFIGTARSLYESITGKNLITGEQLSAAERIMATLGVVTGGYSMKTSKVFKVVDDLVTKVAPKAHPGFKLVRDYFAKLGAVTAEKSTATLRKINLVNPKREDWGLTKTHLEKHFFDKESEFAMINIDPSGKLETWLDNIADAAQRPVTKVWPKSGMLDMQYKYPKADGSGLYDLGIRLKASASNDGSFDFVTVLTKQD